MAALYAKALIEDRIGDYSNPIDILNLNIMKIRKFYLQLFFTLTAMIIIEPSYAVNDTTNDSVSVNVDEMEKPFYDLKSREYISGGYYKPNINEHGKVVVEIIVDKTGHVVKAIPGLRGSTTLNNSLLKACKKAALSILFSPRPDGPDYQKGTITYVF